MKSINDVAQYVVDCFDEPITTMKLQKLVYMAQGWALATMDRPLFEDDFKAWTYGPVSPTLYSRHKRMFTVNQWQDGNKANLDPVERAVVDGVINNYGVLSGQQLSALSHTPNGPWDLARKREGVADGSRGHSIIDKEDMKMYFRQELGLQHAIL